MEKDKIIINDLSQIYAALGDETRLNIAVFLLDNPSSVNKISESLSLIQPSVSHHLRILKDRKIVKSEKSGKNVIYSIDDDHIAGIIKMGISHMEC